MTYERGKATADAPVTWRHSEESQSIYIVTLGYDAAISDLRAMEAK